MTELTINIPVCHHRRLSEAARTVNCSVADVIVAVVRRLTPVKAVRIVPGRRIRYQADSPDGWTVVHVPVADELYEKCLDLRRYLKCSVSLLVVEELARSLNSVLQDLVCGEEDFSCGNFFSFTSAFTGNYFMYTVIHTRSHKTSG
jgi:hypothetical protein